MKFIFSCKKDFTRSLRSLVKNFFHWKINFICWRHRIISSIYFVFLLQMCLLLKVYHHQLFVCHWQKSFPLLMVKSAQFFQTLTINICRTCSQLVVLMILQRTSTKHSAMKLIEDWFISLFIIIVIITIR